MVKLPTTEDPIPEGVENRTQFMHDFGALIAIWSEFEIGIEVAITRLTGMPPLKASIVLGGLGFGSKASILYSLLRLEGNEDAIKRVKAVVSFARRNALIHAALGAEDKFTEFNFFHREVGDQYKVRRHAFTADTFHEHFLRFRELHADAENALNVDSDAVEEYARGAQFYSPAS